MATTDDLLVMESAARAERRYREAEAAMTAFKAKHAGTLNELAQLAEERDAAVSALEKLARQKGDSVGPCVLRSKSWRVDAEKLLSKLGEAGFKAAGGEIVREPKISITAYRNAEKEGLISRDDAGEMLKPTVSFEIPAKVVLP